MITRPRLAAVFMTASLTLYGSLIVTAGFLQASPGQKKPPAKKPSASAGKPSAETLALGKKVYDKNGCATCHTIAGKGGMAGPDLTHTGDPSTHTAKWLADQVANPKAHTPDSTMPPFAQTIKGQELTAMGVYLASLKTPVSLPTGGGKAAIGGAAPDAATVDKITKMGGSVGPLAQNDNHLEVSLHQAGAAATDSSLTVLSSLKNVVHLDLGQTGITDAGLAYVKPMKGLTELHLEGTKITDNGLTSLQDLRELTYLNLYNTNITDAGLDHLTHLTNLRHLYVWQTKVTQAGVDKLKKALPQLEIVQGFDVAPKK